MTWRRSGNKFHATKAGVDGITFDSRKEAAAYVVLRRDPTVARLDRQVSFPLDAHGHVICRYVADFVVTRTDGEVQVIDVKSAFTAKLPVYRLKRKLFRANYGVDIVEMTS